jgi:hypothetical protein
MTDEEKTTCRFTTNDKKEIAETAQLAVTDVEDVI